MGAVVGFGVAGFTVVALAGLAVLFTVEAGAVVAGLAVCVVVAVWVRVAGCVAWCVVFFAFASCAFAFVAVGVVCFVACFVVVVVVAGCCVWALAIVAVRRLAPRTVAIKMLFIGGLFLFLFRQWPASFWFRQILFRRDRMCWSSLTF